MAKLKLFDKIKAELKDSLTKVNKGSIEKKSQKNAKSKPLAKDFEDADDYSGEANVTNQNTQVSSENNDGFLGDSEDFGPEFITNSDVKTNSNIINTGLLAIGDNGEVFVIGESGNSVDDLVQSFQQHTIAKPL